MKAVLYDIHGNLPALEAVLADAERMGADTVVLGGDYAMAGAAPAQCMERLRALPATWIRGNTERWVDDPTQAPADPLIQAACAYARAELGAEGAAELARLPQSAELDGVLFCHGSPRSDMETFMPDPAGREEQLLAGSHNRVVVFGHSHLQFTRELSGRTLVNPGSVGMPLDGDRRAAYALWEAEARFELRRVAYDVPAYVADVRARMSGTLGDSLETLVARIRHASV